MPTTTCKKPGGRLMTTLWLEKIAWLGPLISYLTILAEENGNRFPPSSAIAANCLHFTGLGNRPESDGLSLEDSNYVYAWDRLRAQTRRAGSLGLCSARPRSSSDCVGHDTSHGAGFSTLTRLGRGGLWMRNGTSWETVR